MPKKDILEFHRPYVGLPEWPARDTVSSGFKVLHSLARVGLANG